MNKTWTILKTLAKGIKTTAELIDGIIPGYDETYKDMIRKTRGYMDVPHFDYKQWKIEEQNKFYTLISHLKKDGLITKINFHDKSTWEITHQGLKRLGFLNNKKVLPKIKYKPMPDNHWNIIIFDVPEKFKYKRVWLRKQLKSLGFKLLQKSVWIGKKAIPETFIDDLKQLRLLPNIHIFAVSKRGSLTDKLLE